MTAVLFMRGGKLEKLLAAELDVGCQGIIGLRHIIPVKAESEQAGEALPDK